MKIIINYIWTKFTDLSLASYHQKVVLSCKWQQQQLIWDSSCTNAITKKISKSMLKLFLLAIKRFKYSYIFFNRTSNLASTVYKNIKSSIDGSSTLYQAPQTFSLPLEQLLQHYYSCQGLNRNVSAIFYKSIIKTWCAKNWTPLVSGLDRPKNKIQISLDQKHWAREFLELDV